MRKYKATIAVLVIAILLTLSLAGCRKSSPTTAEGTQEAPADAAQPAAAEQPQARQPQQVAPAPTRTTTVTTPQRPPQPRQPATEQLADYKDQKVKRLIAKADEKVTSYAFYYQTSANWNLIRDQYFIRGDAMKVKLFEVNFYNRKHYFDTVYLDMAAKTGLAYCESRHESRCLDQNREFIVDYNDFIIKTPYEWVKEVPFDAVWTGGEQIDNRAAEVVEYDRPDGTTVRIKIDAYAGLPREVWIFRGDVENTLERYAFRDFSINSVKGSDVEHQFI